VRSAVLSPRELQVIAGWWHTGTVKEAAEASGLSVQTAKNVLYTARLRSGAPTTLALARMYAKELPSLATVRRKAKKAKAA
jgi:hypothetical protein